MNYKIQLLKICTVLRIGQVYYRSERTSYCTISFFTFKNIFRICFVIWYELFLYYLVKKESVHLISLSCFNPYFLL